jgi:hypothetical protein
MPPFVIGCVAPACWPDCFAVPQPPAAARQKDKFVPLSRAPQQGQPPDLLPGNSSSSSSQPGASAFPLTSAQRGGGIDYGSGGKPVPAPTIFEDLDGEGPGTKGRITAVTVAEGLDRKKIEALLKVCADVWVQMRDWRTARTQALCCCRRHATSPQAHVAAAC